MEQSGKKWHEFRKKGIGSSEVAILFGFHDYQTPFTLYQDKISKKIEKDEPNFVQQKGHKLEIVARAKFNLMNDKNFEPKLIAREDGPFRISLDGFFENEIIEIKYTGKNFNQVPPEHHFLQMQYQLLVSGCTKCFYIQINDALEINVTEILPNQSVQAEIQDKVLAFWELVKNKTPPPFCKDDVLPIQKEKIKTIKEVLKLKEKIKKLSDALDEKEKFVLEGLEKYSYQYGKLKITYSERKGAIDYGKILELQNVDLEKYRKKSSGSWAIKELK